MIGTLTLVTQPAAQPVTIGEARAHVRRGDVTDDDAYLEALIGAATTYVETVTGRALVTRTYDWKRDRQPTVSEGYGFRVPRPPLVSVTSVSYLDTAGALQTLATTVYEAADTNGEITPGRIVLKPDQEWPELQTDKVNAVTVRFVAGYGAPEAVPHTLRQAILMLVAHWYVARTPVVTGTIVADMPLSVEAMLAPWRVWGFG